MNAYCRRAVAHGVTLARETGGTCTVLTLGPPSAEDVLREAVAWGADDGLHVCDEAFAGSDTLATARALAAALERSGPYDLVLVGRNSLDGETGQVGPELAELLGLPFADGVKALEDCGGRLRLELELDDGMQQVEVELPAVLSVAERLCDPCKVASRRPGRRAGGAHHPAGTPRTRTRTLGPGRKPDRGGADAARWNTTAPARSSTGRWTCRWRRPCAPSSNGEPSPPRPQVPAPNEPPPAERAGGDRIIAVLLEPGRPQVGVELVGAAAHLAATCRRHGRGAGAGRRCRTRPQQAPTSCVHWSAPSCRATWLRP